MSCLYVHAVKHCEMVSIAAIHLSVSSLRKHHSYTKGFGCGSEQERDSDRGMSAGEIVEYGDGSGSFTFKTAFVLPYIPWSVRNVLVWRGLIDCSIFL